MLHRRPPCIGISMIFLGSVVFGCAQSHSTNSASSTSQFDGRLWTESVGARNSMLADLEANHLQKRMSRQDIVALLGQPDRAGVKAAATKGDPYPNGSRYIYYDLDNGGASKNASLFVILDASDEVIDWGRLES